MPKLCALAIVLLLTSVAVGDDWPQWLGPKRDGSTAEKVTPWKGELKTVWRKSVGEGHSSPIVVDGRVYLHTRVAGKDAEAVDCFEAATGKELWKHEYPRGPFQGLFGSGPRSTPTFEGGKLYAYGATGILTCLDAKTGAKHWQSDTHKTFKAPTLKFGDSTSPVVVGNKVVVNVGAKGASIVAFDKDSGEVQWKALDDGASYASPIVIGPDNDSAVVFLTQKGLVSLRVQDGSVQWDFPFADKLLESSTTPVRVGNRILVSSISLGTALVSLEPDGDKIKAKKVWSAESLPCYFSTPVCVGTDHAYLVTGSLFGGSSSVHCVDVKTGKALWSKGGVGKYHASLMRTGDNKLLMLEEAGSLVLLEPNPEKYVELARAKICGQTWAHPALANGKLYIRDDKKELICVSLEP